MISRATDGSMIELYFQLELHARRRLSILYGHYLSFVQILLNDRRTCYESKSFSFLQIQTFAEFLLKLFYIQIVYLVKELFV